MSWFVSRSSLSTGEWWKLSKLWFPPGFEGTSACWRLQCHPHTSESPKCLKLTWCKLRIHLVPTWISLCIWRGIPIGIDFTQKSPGPHWCLDGRDFRPQWLQASERLPQVVTFVAWSTFSWLSCWLLSTWPERVKVLFKSKGTVAQLKRSQISKF